MDGTYFVYNVRVRPVVEEQLRHRLVAPISSQDQRRSTILRETTQPRSHAIADTQRNNHTHRTPFQPSYTTPLMNVLQIMYCMHFLYGTYSAFNVRVRPVVEEQLRHRLVALNSSPDQRRSTLLRETTQPRSHAIADTRRNSRLSS
jgi:hypothetical protein